MPAGQDLYAEETYAKAAENFQQLIRDAPLEIEAEPSLYLYRLRMGEHTQVGRRRLRLRGRVRRRPDPQARAHAPRQGGRPHAPRADPARADRPRLPHLPRRPPHRRARRRRDARRSRSTTSKPRTACATPSGAPPARSNSSAASRRCRCSTSPTATTAPPAPAAPAPRLRDQNPNHTGDEEYNRFLAVIFPADQMRILPYNRVVKDLNGLSEDDFLSKVARAFRRDRRTPTRAAPASPATGTCTRAASGTA